MAIRYPESRKTDQVDDYHGTQVPDPYRWLEETDSPEARAWIEAQNRVTFDYLSRIPQRERIRERLTRLWDYPRVSPPARMGDRYFQLRNSGLQNQEVLYVMDSYDSQGHVLLDPNSFSDAGTVALSNWEPSPDGNYLAYATSDSGSDWMTWRIRDVATGEDLPDRIEWSKFSNAAWRNDGTGFYYSRFDEPVPGEDYTAANYYQKLFFHRLGDPQSRDVLIYERPDQKEWGFFGLVSDDDRYLVINVSHGTSIQNLIFYQDLDSGGDVVELIDEFEATYDFVGSSGPIFYFRTNLDASRGRLIAVDITRPEHASWQDIIPESEHTLEHVFMVHGEFITLYLSDARHRLMRFDLKGTLVSEIELPTLGSIPSVGYFLYLTGKPKHDEFFYGFASFTYPISIYRFDLRSEASELVYAPALDIDTDQFTTRQVFVTSKDGAQIPMFLTHRQDIALDGQNPTMLYGYGGFNIALVPTFDVGRLVWLEMGGVLAWANLRGGGEYGEQWHQAGMLDRKQNVFDDFIACAEFLVTERISSTTRLSITGRSNGGLLVGACLTQRPDLFGAAVPIVGVMDMLRFEKFTIGWAWVSDYGSPSDPQQFETLYAYSPLHNLKPGASYPATLITTGDHDDRVVPGHSFKFAAALQACQAGEAPTLIRIQTRAGHGVGKPTALLIEETADILAFLAHELGFDPGSG